MPRRAPREISVAVTALSEDGLGAGTFESRPVEARNALPGEQVTVRVLKRRRGVWSGEAETPEVPAPQRRVPACAAYPRCGGCALQHVDYGLQLEHKTGRLLAALAEHHVHPARVRPAVTGPRFHYRFKARLGVRVVGESVLAGFREGFSNRVVRMDDCKTLALPFARMLPELKHTLARLHAPDRIPQVELAGGDRHFAVVIRHLDPLTSADLHELRQFAARSGLFVYLQPGGYDTVAALEGAPTVPYLHYANPDYGLSYRFQPTDFTQVNPYMNRALVRAALLALAPPSGSTVTDLFCGIGNFSLALARLGVIVRGYEASEAAVVQARANADHNALAARAEFALADLYDARSPDLPASPYLLLDPPRSGAGENLERWLSWPSLLRVAYVSCNPRTFASDAARFRARGFELREVGIFDMFPHTAHVETLGLFVRTGAAGG